MIMGERRLGARATPVQSRLRRSRRLPLSTIKFVATYLMFACMIQTISSCSISPESSYEYRYLGWDVLTRFRYDSDDLTRASKAHGKLKTAELASIKTWLDGRPVGEECKIELLDQRFAVFGPESKLHYAAGRFCLCDVEQNQCVEIDRKIRATISRWVQ